MHVKGVFYKNVQGNCLYSNYAFFDFRLVFLFVWKLSVTLTINEIIEFCYN